MRSLLIFLLFTCNLHAQGLIVDPFKFGGASSSLNTSLIAYWKLDEASGTRVDSEPTGTAQDLTDVNTVTSDTGIIGNAAKFTAANAERLSRADSADLSTGNIDFSFTFWVWLDDKTTSQTFISKFTTTGNQREFYSLYNQPTDNFRFIVSADGTSTVGTASATTFGSPSISTWYFIFVSHDAASNLLKISVNDGTVNTTAWTTGVFDGTSEFNVGAFFNGTSPNNGRIDEVAFYKKALSAAEITELYNAGAAKTCCPF